MPLPDHKGRSRNVNATTRKAFGRQLEQMLDLRGMSRSDLARAVFGSRIDSRGYNVAAGRDRITNYIAGKVWPDPEVVERLCEALDCTVADLVPEPETPPTSIHFERDGKNVRARFDISGAPGEMYALIQLVNDMACEPDAAADACARLEEMLRARARS